MKERKKIIDDIWKVKNLKRQFEWARDLFPSDEIPGQLDECLERLEDRLAKLPLGHRYIGDYYLKKPGYPVEFEKRSGAVFMREDLISWVEEDKGDDCMYSYLRNVYKAPDMDSPLVREDGKGVYEGDAQ